MNRKEIASNFGNNIKSLRTKLGLTQKQLASKLGYCSNTLKNWEKGKVGTNAEALFRVASFFNVSADYLLGLED